MIHTGKLCVLWAKTRADNSKYRQYICFKNQSFGSPMFIDYKYSVISITSFSRFLLLSTSNIRMSEGTFCRVEVQISIFQIFKDSFFHVIWWNFELIRIFLVSLATTKKSMKALEC